MYLSYKNANVKAYLKDGNLLFHLKQPYESTYLQKETIFMKFVKVVLQGLRIKGSQIVTERHGNG